MIEAGIGTDKVFTWGAFGKLIPKKGFKLLIPSSGKIGAGNLAGVATGVEIPKNGLGCSICIVVLLTGEFKCCCCKRKACCKG